MNINTIQAEFSLQDQCEGKSPEETIDICKSVIKEAERLIDIAKDELKE